MDRAYRAIANIQMEMEQLKEALYIEKKRYEAFRRCTLEWVSDDTYECIMKSAADMLRFDVK